MAKAKKSPVAAVESADTSTTVDNTTVETPAAGTVVTHDDGSTEVFNPPVVREKTKQELKAEEAQAKIKAKADKIAAAEAKKAEAEKAKAAKITMTAEERKAKQEEREARLAALKAEGKNYVGSMLALADRVKQGVYVKSKTGQLCNGDELATALTAVGPLGVVQVAMEVLGETSNKYAALNIGQQSMNYRNRLRGAVKAGKTTIDAIKEVVTKLDLDASAQIEAKAKEKADVKAKRDAEAKAKADAKLVAEAKAETPEPETTEA